MWERIFLDNTIRSYVIAAVLFILLIIFKRGLSRFLASFIYKFIALRWKNIDKQEFVNLVVNPISIFLLVFAGSVILNSLNFPSALDFKIGKTRLSFLFDKLVLLAIILSVFWLLFRLIEFISLILKEKARLTSTSSDDQLVIFFRDFFKAIVLVVCLFWIIAVVFNKDITTLLTGLSIVGAAIALAAKESLENLIASFIIFFDKPFTVGDFVKVNAIQGTVEKIGLRSTRVRTVEKSLVTVPNKQMVDSVVDNISLQSQRRGLVTLDLKDTTSATDANEFLNICRKVIREHETQIPVQTVFLSNYSKAGATITIEYFTSMIPINDFNELKEKINLELMKELQKAGLILSATTSTVNVYQDPLQAPKSDIL